MRITVARAALRKALEAQSRLDAIQKMIAPDNGDVRMVGAVNAARSHLEIAIAQLCKIVPNADLLYRPSPPFAPITEPIPMTQTGLARPVPDRKSLASGIDADDIEDLWGKK